MRASFATTSMPTPPTRVADQMMLHRRAGEQRGDRRLVRIVTAVGENDDVVSLGDTFGDGPAQILERLAQTSAVLPRIEQDRQRDRLQRPIEPADPFQLFVRKNR